MTFSTVNSEGNHSLSYFTDLHFFNYDLSFMRCAGALHLLITALRYNSHLGHNVPKVPTPYNLGSVDYDASSVDYLITSADYRAISGGHG